MPWRWVRSPPTAGSLALIDTRISPWSLGAPSSERTSGSPRTRKVQNLSRRESEASIMRYWHPLNHDWFSLLIMLARRFSFWMRSPRPLPSSLATLCYSSLRAFSLVKRTLMTGEDMCKKRKDRGLQASPTLHLFRNSETNPKSVPLHSRMLGFPVPQSILGAPALTGQRGSAQGKSGGREGPCGCVVPNASGQNCDCSRQPTRQSVADRGRTNDELRNSMNHAGERPMHSIKIVMFAIWWILAAPTKSLSPRHESVER